MTDKLFDTLLDKALGKAGEAAELAFLLYEFLMNDGAYPEEAWDALQRYGYLDENGKWKQDYE